MKALLRLGPLALFLASAGMIQAQADSLMFPFRTRQLEDLPNRHFLFEDGFYAYVSDAFGTPLLQRYHPGGLRNMLAPDDSTLAYYDRAVGAFILLDRKFNHLDTFRMEGGAEVDFHFFGRGSDQNYMLLGSELRNYSAEQLPWESSRPATIRGAVIQEFSPGGSLIYQWKSLDSYPPSEATSCMVNTGADVIDYIHVNHVQADTDTSWLICCRNLSQVLRVDKRSGGLIWQLGGSEGDFPLQDESMQFSGQHSAMIHPDGRLSLFDNAVCKNPKVSRALVYDLHEADSVPVLLEELTPGDPVFTLAMGSYFLYAGGRSLAGWGKNARSLLFTEYLDGELVLEAWSKDGSYIYPYAVHALDWVSPVSLHPLVLPGPGKVFPGDSLELEIECTNTCNLQLEARSGHFSSLDVQVREEMPFRLDAGQTATLKLRIIAGDAGLYGGPLTIHFRVVDEEESSFFIGSQIDLQVEVSTGTVLAPLLPDPGLQVYHVPSMQQLNIYSRESLKQCSIFDLQGRLRHQFGPLNPGWHSYQTRLLEPGMYILLTRSIPGRTSAHPFSIHKNPLQ